MEIQGERNQQSKAIEQFKTENKKYLANMNRRINDGKIYHEQLTEEVKFVQEFFAPPTPFPFPIVIPKVLAVNVAVYTCSCVVVVVKNILT